MLDTKSLNTLADCLLGTQEEAATRAGALEMGDDLSKEMLEEQLLGVNVERCPCCGLWVESSDIVMDQWEPGDRRGCVACTPVGEWE